jgi:hypothetical protein
MGLPGKPSAGYNFNSFQEIKSHSSILFNERLAILLYILDMRSMQMNKSYSIDDIHEVRSVLYQIYKNIRMLVRFNPVMRVTMNLETKNEGIYVTDLMFSTIDKMIEYCEVHGYTIKRLYIITQEINRTELVIKDMLQYYHYFIRPDFKQKPDIEIATEQYKEIADKKTVEELREIVGMKHHVDFEGFGSNRIELQEKDMDYIESDKESNDYLIEDETEDA